MVRKLTKLQHLAIQAFELDEKKEMEKYLSNRRSLIQKTERRLRKYVLTVLDQILDPAEREIADTQMSSRCLRIDDEDQVPADEYIALAEIGGMTFAASSHRQSCDLVRVCPECQTIIKIGYAHSVIQVGKLLKEIPPPCSVCARAKGAENQGDVQDNPSPPDPLEKLAELNPAAKKALADLPYIYEGEAVLANAVLAVALEIKYLTEATENSRNW